MATRPLRQFYDEAVTLDVASELSSVVEPWRRHRQRLLARLAELDEGGWANTSRCDAWSTQEVICHLASADAFWAMSLLGAKERSPTSVLNGFDPSTSPDGFLGALRDAPGAEVLEAFSEATSVLDATVSSLDEADWAATGESPLGHVSASLVLAHAHWDSWLHERDIFVPLGEEPPVEPDELMAAAWYTLVFGAAQCGLLNDPSPVGVGLTEPVEATFTLDDLADTALSLRIDEGVRLRVGDPEASTGHARAVDLIEELTGRPTGNPSVAATLPPDLLAELIRATELL